MKIRTAKKVVKKSLEHTLRSWTPRVITLIYLRRWKDLRRYTFYSMFLQRKAADRLHRFYKYKE